MKKIIYVIILCMLLCMVSCGDKNDTPKATAKPTDHPTITNSPAVSSTEVPTKAPTLEPTKAPTPTVKPTEAPTPTVKPTEVPTPPPAPQIDYQNALYLSDLYGTDECVSWVVTMSDSTSVNPQRVPGIDADYNMTEGPLHVGDELFDKGISIHPRADKDGEITFDVSKYTYERFTVTIGNGDSKSTGIKAYVFFDYGNGFMEVASTDSLVYPNTCVYDIEVAGVKSIKLSVNCDGVHSYDTTGFGDCMLYNFKG